MRLAWALAAVGVLVGGCSAHRTPDLRPSPPAQVEASLTAFPQVGISGQVVRLWARLKDPLFAVRCPSLTWVWQDETRSSHTEDCDPAERVAEHIESRRIAVYHGDNTVMAIWSYEGREWRATVMVPVP